MHRLLSTNEPLKQKLVFFTAIKFVLLCPFTDGNRRFPYPPHSYTSTRDNELILSWLQLANFLLFHVPEVWKRYPFRVAPFRFLIVCFNRTHAKACKSEDDDDGDMKWRNMILMINILRPEKSAIHFFWQNSVEGIKWIRSGGFWW